MDPATNLDSFTRWFNKNLKGETIITADAATVRARLRQWTHLNGDNDDEAADLSLRVAHARVLAGASLR